MACISLVWPYDSPTPTTSLFHYLPGHSGHYPLGVCIQTVPWLPALLPGLMAPVSRNLTYVSNPGRGNLAPQAGSAAGPRVHCWSPRAGLFQGQGRYRCTGRELPPWCSSRAVNRNTPCTMVRKQEKNSDGLCGQR